LVITGTPARIATASFSPRPQAGKLNALMWTATPSRGVHTCAPKKRALLVSGSAGSTIALVSPSFFPSPA